MTQLMFDIQVLKKEKKYFNFYGKKFPLLLESVCAPEVMFFHSQRGIYTISSLLVNFGRKEIDETRHN